MHGDHDVPDRQRHVLSVTLSVETQLLAARLQFHVVIRVKNQQLQASPRAVPCRVYDFEASYWQIIPMAGFKGVVGMAGSFPRNRSYFISR